MGVPGTVLGARGSGDVAYVLGMKINSKQNKWVKEHNMLEWKDEVW